MNRKLLLEIGAMIVLAINYAIIFVLAVIWELNPLLVVPIVFIFSLLFGAIIEDLGRTVIYASISMVLSMFLAIGIFSAPPIILGEDMGSVDFFISMTLTPISRHFIISIVFVITGVIVGCIVSDSLLETYDEPSNNTSQIP